MIRILASLFCIGRETASPVGVTRRGESNVITGVVILCVVLIVLGMAIPWYNRATRPNHPPIACSFRQSRLDSNGLVWQVRNTSARHLSCVSKFENKIMHDEKVYRFSLGPNTMEEIGVLEAAWTFKTGETITLWVEGFDPTEYKVP